MRFRNDTRELVPGSSLNSSRMDFTDFHRRTIKFKSRANARESRYNPLPRDFLSELTDERRSS